MRWGERGRKRDRDGEKDRLSWTLRPEIRSFFLWKRKIRSNDNMDVSDEVSKNWRVSNLLLPKREGCRYIDSLSEETRRSRCVYELCLHTKVTLSHYVEQVWSLYYHGHFIHLIYRFWKTLVQNVAFSFEKTNFLMSARC